MPQRCRTEAAEQWDINGRSGAAGADFVQRRFQRHQNGTVKFWDLLLGTEARMIEPAPWKRSSTTFLSPPHTQTTSSWKTM